ncbi:tRNA lysidine(34) synthetase TilS [Rhodanobacter sp. BL-MT-08]
MSDALKQHLASALAQTPALPLCVGFSGGPDSTALLHALAELPESRARGLRALHVDHGMSPQSAAWAEHCERFCETLNVPCEVIPVQVELDKGFGLEAAARHARYAAFESSLQHGEYLLLAHHRDDQAETVLLKLLRGAGPDSLGGMRALRPFARGQLWRPLLDLSRQQLRDYLDARQLPSIDDPSNGDTRFARNHLRHDILPRLERLWPQAVDSIVHSAALSRAAADALQVQWLAAFDALHDPAVQTIDAAGWLALHPALREPLLDHWLHGLGLPAPTTAQRQQIEHQCNARAGQQPCVQWRGAELHIWRGRLWAQSPPPIIDSAWQATWHGEPLALPDGGTLSLANTEIRLAQPIQVRLRQGGERIKPAGDAYTRELRDLFQQAMIPPWRRPGVPLLYIGTEIVGVADRWLSERGKLIFEQAGTRACWSPAR